MDSASKVALIYCDTYELDVVREAIKKGFSLLGSAELFARKNEKIVIKPNMLVGDPAKNAVSPNPSIFQAVLEEFLKTGAKISFGDSPAVGSPRSVARQTGLLKVADELGVPLADFKNSQTVSFPDGNSIKQFTFAKAVLEADGIISLCKFKSHALTRITGAIKNQFGCIPGVQKSEYHAILPNAAVFSRMLVDINLFLRPRLFIMDGIIAMEGNGPRNGTKKPMNVIIMSSDPVALDTTVCRMINLDETLVDTIVYGEQFGLGTTQVEILGDPLEQFIAPDFQVNRSELKTTVGKTFIFSNLMRNYVSPRPTIDPTTCVCCGKCVEVCPAQPKALSWQHGKKSPPVYDYSKCIRCYCCQELCPHRAVTVKTPFLGRVIHN
jgi:uncharacterized protein (DUF362 family)/NAD-dependent dihydropyrimidine dehydrogenase PreA subunit